MTVHSSYCYSPFPSSCFPASVCSSQPNRVSANCWHVTNSQLLHFGLWGATGMHECIHAECRIRSVHVQREKLRWILTQITTFSSEVNFQLSILNLFYLEKNKKTPHNFFPLPLAFMADLCSLLCLGVLRGSPLHSAITLTLFTLALRSGSTGEPWALCSEPDGVLEGDTDWLDGQPVSSIVNRHTDSNSQEQAGSVGQAANTSRQSELKVQPRVLSDR